MEDDLNSVSYGHTGYDTPEDEAAARKLLEAMDDSPESLESVTAAEISAEDAPK